MFSENEKQAIITFKQFAKEEANDKCFEDWGRTVLSDTQARQVIEIVLNKRSTKILPEMSKADRDAVLHELKDIEGLSICQISRLTGMSFNIVKRAAKRHNKNVPLCLIEQIIYQMI